MIFLLFPKFRKDFFFQYRDQVPQIGEKLLKISENFPFVLLPLFFSTAWCPCLCVKNAVKSVKASE
jgi:hypothetical protein